MNEWHRTTARAALRMILRELEGMEERDLTTAEKRIREIARKALEKKP